MYAPVSRSVAMIAMLSGASASEISVRWTRNRRSRVHSNTQRAAGVSRPGKSASTTHSPARTSSLSKASCRTDPSNVNISFLSLADARRM
ncbi:hypothetical protein ACRJ4B_43140 [Streptomyces sp. GTA36]